MIKLLTLSLLVTKFKYVGVKQFKFLNLKDFSSKQILQILLFKFIWSLKTIIFNELRHFVFHFCEYSNEWFDRQ